jgi:nitrogen regulatory protein P-II 1
MKQINALVHHIRSAPVVDALRDAGVTNITLLDVKGTLRPLSESEQEYSVKAGLAVISEVRISLVCEDYDVARITDIIRQAGRIGSSISGWVYVSPIEQVLPIGGADSEALT